MLRLNENEYRSKLLGCWLGKNIGGTLGAPFEWKRQTNDVTFYANSLNGDPLPNDDLDLQLLWLVALEERGVVLDARTLGDYWMMFVTPHWAEYGVAKANMKAGLQPPLSGTAHNPFKDSCGAFIRSEIWACIAPGAPGVAARYAYEDAIIDHGDGEGLYAELFCAAMESAAFVISEIPRLIEIGLSYIPPDCGVARAIRSTMASHAAGVSWETARDTLLRDFRGQASPWGSISTQEREKGFADGPLGWDAPSNIGIIITGLLYGDGDFERTLCLTVNCGEDTDCTAGTLGALFGILHGVEAIPERWIAPIGHGIKTACLNLGELGYYGDQLPATIDELTDRVVALTRQTIAAQHLPIALVSDQPTDLSDLDPAAFGSSDAGLALHGSATSVTHRFDWFQVAIDYQGDATIQARIPRTLRVRVTNTYKTSEMLHVRLYGPSGATFSPAGTTSVFCPTFDPVRIVPMEITLDTVEPTNRLVVQVTVAGRATVMLMPVVLLGT
jgi:ADP-ribosylglycohydrolase